MSTNKPNNIDKNKAKVDEIAQEQKNKVSNLQETLQNETPDQTAIKSAIIGVITSLLIKFINSDKIINNVISNLIIKTKRKLKNKGRVEVKDKSVVIFYPKLSGNYSSLKIEFNNKKAKLQQTIKTLKTIVDSLIVVLRVLKTTLIILKLQLRARKAQLLVIAAASGPDLSSPNPSKPIAAQYPVNKEVDDQLTKELEDKINNYILIISFVQTILITLQQMLTRAKIKVDKLSFNINTDIVSDDRTAQVPVSENDNTEYNNGSKTFEIKVVTTPSGALQAIAYDSFSKMKITQTAPSKTRKADELINELKQILG